MTTVSGESLLGLPIVGNEGLSRVLIEHGDGRWSAALVRKSLKEQFPDRPVDAEFTFTIESVIDTAQKAFSGDPAIGNDRFAGRKLAAAVLMFSLVSGLIDQGKSS